MSTVTIRVNGVPAPQGSKTAFVRNGKAILVDGNTAAKREKHANWRADVRDAALDWREANNVTTLIDQPVHLKVAFDMPRPKSRRRDTYHATTPDLSKLVRATEDALTGIVWRDDCLVALLTVGKRYVPADGSATPGATITIEPLESQ